jgi:hypothetical protein
MKTKKCLRCEKELKKIEFLKKGKWCFSFCGKKYCDECSVLMQEESVLRSQKTLQQKLIESRELEKKEIKKGNCIRCGAEIAIESKYTTKKYCDNCRLIGYRENSLRSSVKYNADNKRAISLINSNLKSGHITVIYECLHDGKKHKHHFDYQKYPLLVLSLCPDCHMKEHKRLRRLYMEASRFQGISDTIQGSALGNNAEPETLM